MAERITSERGLHPFQYNDPDRSDERMPRRAPHTGAGSYRNPRSARDPMNQASTDSVNDYEPDVLRVFQTKDETRLFYTKITHTYDLLAEHSEQSCARPG